MAEEVAIGGEVQTGEAVAPQTTETQETLKEEIVDNPEINDTIDEDSVNDDEDVYSLDKESFVNHLNENYNFTQEELAQINSVQEKFGLDNKSLEAVIKVEADKINENMKSKRESVKKELDTLTPEEKKEVKSVYEFFMKTLPENERAEFENNYTTAKFFREAKAKMGDSSQSIPDLNVENVANNSEFTEREYFEASSEIRKAEKNSDFLKAEDLTKKLKKDIINRGSAKMKRQFANFIK